jgi:hypothetical protein
MHAFGCAAFQVFYFSKPVPLADFHKSLTGCCLIAPSAGPQFIGEGLQLVGIEADVVRGDIVPSVASRVPIALPIPCAGPVASATEDSIVPVTEGSSSCVKGNVSAAAVLGRQPGQVSR